MLLLFGSIRVVGLWMIAGSLGVCAGFGQGNGAGQSGQAGSGRSSQTSGSAAAANTGTDSSSAAATIEVTGRVVDARNRQPIGRALVRFGARAVLTDHDGVFDFPAVSSTSGTFVVSKPGYYASPDGENGSSRTFRFPVTSAIELPLYPEAILSGTAADPTGESIPRLSVTARRSIFDENGHRWVTSGQAQTASDGSFRVAVPPGVYSLTVSQRGRPTAGAEIVLPVSIPAVASSLSEAIHLGMGEEVHLDLRPESRKSYRVDLTVEPEMRGFPTLSARTGDGASMPVSAIPSRGEDRAEVRVALPSGSYTLVGSIQSPDGMAEAKTQVTVTDHDVSGIALRFSPVPSLPVVVETDSAATTDGTTKVPDAIQLGLSLQVVGGEPDASGQMYRVMTRRNGIPGFSLPDGMYRLRAQAGGQWSITSAICGGVDLLSQDLPVSSDLNGTEVRVRVSNQTANLTGTVTLNGAPAAAWVYLLSTTPSATPVLLVRSSSDGSFFRPYLAVGSYRAVALERKIGADMQAAGTLEKFLDRVQSFSVSSREQRTLNLVAVPEQELPQ